MVEGGGLENRYPARDQGFESSLLRQFLRSKNCPEAYSKNIMEILRAGRGIIF